MHIDLDEKQRAVSLLESSLKLKRKPYLFSDELFRVEPGTLLKVAYAMPGSRVEVRDGAKLDLFMADEGTTIKLCGPQAFLKIEKVTRHLKGLRIVGPDGAGLTEGLNLELGEGIVEKLLA